MFKLIANETDAVREVMLKYLNRKGRNTKIESKQKDNMQNLHICSCLSTKKCNKTPVLKSVCSFH